MSRIAYVNGLYVPHREAAVHIEDRGYQFADGVYEVVAVRQGILVDLGPHLDRLDRSLGEVRIRWPMTRGALAVVLAETVRRNRVVTGIAYLQVTRGVARRAHAFPARTAPAVVVTARTLAPPSARVVRNGVRVITVTDIRWRRCDIKSVALLANVLARQQAAEAGAYEAWLVDGQGLVSEGSSTNAWIVDRRGALVTRELGPSLLGGVTRGVLLQESRGDGIRVVERPFSVAEARSAREAMITSTTAFVLPVVAIDGVRVGDGRPGPVFQRLRKTYGRHLAGVLRAAAPRSYTSGPSATT